jgi:hypothetical protein
VGLVVVVVRVLPQQHHLHPQEGRRPEGREHLVLGREHLLGLALLVYVGTQVPEILLGQLVLERLAPVVRELHLHRRTSLDAQQ